MADPIKMEEFMPHINIDCGDEIHVYPRRYFERLATGDSVDPLPDKVLRAILIDWLELLDVEDYWKRQ